MNFVETAIPDLFIIKPRVFEDDRGLFVKNFQHSLFIGRQMECDFREFFYSRSAKGVIRGMHFQHPPYDHSKLVFVTAGSVRDVVVDIRAGSPAFGQAVCVELSDGSHQALYIPKGCAHGFLALEENTLINYLQTSEHHPEADAGIRYDSFGFNWKYDNPVVSARDMSFPEMDGFETPFTYGGV